jgi:hypothetical protein
LQAAAVRAAMKVGPFWYKSFTAYLTNKPVQALAVRAAMKVGAAVNAPEVRNLVAAAGRIFLVSNTVPTRPVQYRYCFDHYLE